MDIKKIIKTFSFIVLISSPVTYLWLDDEFFSLLLVIVSVLLYLSVSEYVVKAIQLYKLTITLEEKIEEVNVTQKKFEETLGKLLVSQYLSLSNAGYAIDVDENRKRNIPILDDLRNATGNEGEREIKIARNSVFETNLRATISSMVGTLDRIPNKDKAVSQIMHDLSKFRLTASPIKHPEYIRSIIKDVINNEDIKKLMKNYEDSFYNLEKL